MEQIYRSVPISRVRTGWLGIDRQGGIGASIGQKHTDGLCTEEN